MTKDYESALARVEERRAALRRTIAALQGGATPARLADEALRRLDPDFSVLRRIARRIARNKLLTLAVVAGAGWLAGHPRHGDGEAPAARKAGTEPPQANPKEKKNDSGHHQQRKQRQVLRSGHRRQGKQPKAGAQAQQRSEAEPWGILAARRGHLAHQIPGAQGGGARSLWHVLHFWRHVALQP